MGKGSKNASTVQPTVLVKSAKPVDIQQNELSKVQYTHDIMMYSTGNVPVVKYCKTLVMDNVEIMRNTVINKGVDALPRILNELKEKRKGNGTFRDFDLMRKNQDKLFKALQPPAKYQKQYEIESEIHKMFNELCDMAIDPDADLHYTQHLDKSAKKYSDLCDQATKELQKASR